MFRDAYSLIAPPSSCPKPSNQRNNLKGSELQKVNKLIKKFHQLPKIVPIKKVIKVDDEIPGCPVDEKMVITKFNSYLK